MQTIHHHNFTEKLTTVIEQITQEHQPICLELPNSVKAILLSEEDYSSLMETLYLLSNSINAEKLLQAVNRSANEAISWEDFKNELI
jgi:antitoxin YefM